MTKKYKIKRGFIYLAYPVGLSMNIVNPECKTSRNLNAKLLKSNNYFIAYVRNPLQLKNEIFWYVLGNMNQNWGSTLEFIKKTEFITNSKLFMGTITNE